MAANNPHYNADTNEIDDSKKPDKIIFRPKGLTIVWGNDPRYWRLPTGTKTGGEEDMAVLLQVSWLEVTGSCELDSPYNYRVGFKLSLKPDAFGWNGCPVYLMAKVGKKGRYKWRKINLPGDLKVNEPCYIEDFFKLDPSNQSTSPADKTLYFGLYEVWSGKWKGGLLIEYAIIKRVPQ